MIGNTPSTLTPTATGQNRNVKHWACFSLQGPDWTVCHRSSTSDLILNLCDINHHHHYHSCRPFRFEPLQTCLHGRLTAPTKNLISPHNFYSVHSRTSKAVCAYHQRFPAHETRSVPRSMLMFFLSFIILFFLFM